MPGPQRQVLNQNLMGGKGRKKVSGGGGVNEFGSKPMRRIHHLLTDPDATDSSGDEEDGYPVTLAGRDSRLIHGRGNFVAASGQKSRSVIASDRELCSVVANGSRHRQRQMAQKIWGRNRIICVVYTPSSSQYHVLSFFLKRGHWRLLRVYTALTPSLNSRTSCSLFCLQRLQRIQAALCS